MTTYNFDTTLHPYGPDKGVIGIDSTAKYGYFERKDGSEGGGLWFDRHWQTGNLNLVDFDGATVLPMAVISALRTHGVTVDEEFE